MNIYNKKYWEQNYLDLWSIIHFNSGVLFAFVCVYLQLTLIPSLVLMFILAVVWEIAEFIKFPKEIRESLTNQVTDVLVALLGMTVVFTYLPSPDTAPIFFWVFVIIYVVFATSLAYVGRKAIGGYSKGAI